MVHILPVPKSIETDVGCFRLSLDTYIVMEAPVGELTRTAATQIQDEIKAACGFAPILTSGTARNGDIVLCLKAGKPQGYNLVINERNIVLSGNDEQGLLHGAQTLRQIIRQSGWILSGMNICDAPDYPIRGYYYDQTRGRVNTLAWLKELADEACFYKLNQLQLYMEHTYLFRDTPELWAVANTPLTSEDILELDRYCALRGIQLVPSLASFGHLFELLRIKRFSSMCELDCADEYASTMCNRMMHHTINPYDERAFGLIGAMIDEFLALFSADKFNICADETFDLGKGKNSDKNVSEAYIMFLKKLCAHVAGRNKTPMFWGDILLKYPETLTALPKGAVCLNWFYGADVKEESARAFADTGAQQYVCPGINGWNHWMMDFQTAYQNISKMALYGKKYGAVGLLNTDWGDYGHINDPRFSLPGMIIGACAAWGSLLPQTALWHAISRVAYGDESERIVGLMMDISSAEISAWNAIVQHKEGAMGSYYCNINRPFPRVDHDEAAKADELLDTVTDAVQSCALTMPAEKRPFICNLLVCAEGIRVWNHVQELTAEGRREPVLAEQLLRWLRRYEAMWRETSQESELWRIHELTLWYADKLR